MITKSIKATAEKLWYLKDGTFKNNYIDSFQRSFSDLRKAFKEKMPKPMTFELAKNDPAMLQENRSKTTVTWVGHCTILLQVDGLNILTDPIFTDRASPFSFIGPKRGTPPGLLVKDLPPIDLVLISHNHYDHLDFGSIKMLREHSPDAHYCVPLGLGSWFKRENIKPANVIERDWWEDADINGIKLTCVPTQHWSSRSIIDRNKTLWCGWVVESTNFRYLFIGDTGYSDDFKDIQKKFDSFDLAAIPIGAYNPEWFMKDVHQDPKDAVQCFLDLNAKQAIATHWGTFQLTYEKMDEPVKLLKDSLSEKGLDVDSFFALQHGETRII